MLQNLEQHPQAAQSFYQTYFTDILMQIFSVVTDTSHTASLQNHATILAYMFSLVEAGRITVSLGPSADNVLNVQEYVATLLKSAFNHLTDNQIKIFVTGLFNLDQDVHAFKEHLRDFLIQIKVGSSCRCRVVVTDLNKSFQEVTGEDDSDLYLEERENELKKAQEEKRRVLMTVPGMINPHELPEEMQDE